MNLPLLTLTTFFPLLGGIIILFFKPGQDRAVKATATIFSAISLFFSILVLLKFNSANPGFQLTEKVSWIPPLNVFYYMAVDGLSITMVILTTLLSLISIIASFGIKDRVKMYFALFCLLETAMIGVFVSLDFFLFYVFWEAMLVPMYFLIGIWGGPRREYAAIKFFLYTLFGSVAMLLGILALYFTSMPHTFDMVALTQNQGFDPRFQAIVFGAFFLAFAIKVPVFPFHTWLPDAHVEAPTAVSVILAGVLLKMGTYGLLRVSLPILPQAAHMFMLPMAVLALINIVYGALVSMAQDDLKKLIAYSSISHMGYVLLGIAAMTPTGMNGAVLQMFNHGIITGALFLLVGVIYDRTHTRMINDFGGLAVKLPVYTAVMSIAVFASLGLPGLSGFVSEFMVFVGSFPVFKGIVIASVTGVVITAAFLLWTLQRMFLGTYNDKHGLIPDMSARELVTLVPLLVIMFFVGVYPSPLINLMNSTIVELSRIVSLG